MNHDSPPNPIYNFWNSLPPNGAFHRLIRPHRWSTCLISGLDRLKVANLGEHITAKWAEASGWTVLARQKRHRGFELDLVILRSRNLRIVEVKTRIFPFEEPDMTITTEWLNIKKRRAIKRGTDFVLQEMGRTANQLKSVTFDLVAIDILRNQSLAAYRWPDAFSLE